MVKKLIVILMSLCMTVAFCACGDSSSTGDAGDTAGTEAAASDNAAVQDDGPINYEDEEGIVKFKGIENVSEGFIADDDTDEWKSVVVVEFDYTNKTDEPKQFQNTYWFRVFQNGVEVDNNSRTYHEDNGPDTIPSYYKEVLKGGTVTIGSFFILDDDSDITIILYDNDGEGSGDVLAQMTTPVTFPE